MDAKSYIRLRSTRDGVGAYTVEVRAGWNNRSSVIATYSLLHSGPGCWSVARYGAADAIDAFDKKSDALSWIHDRHAATKSRKES